MNRFTYQFAKVLVRLSETGRQLNEVLRGTRVLMFHDVHNSPDTSNLYTKPSQSFRDCMTSLTNWMPDHNVEFVPFSSTPVPGVAVTFDDGYRSTLHIAAEILGSLHIPSHVFLTKSYVTSGDPRYLNETDVRRLAAIPGVTLGVHGVSHERMPSISESKLCADLMDSRDWLEQLTGTQISTLSYPHGAFSTAVAKIVEDSGFTAAACSDPGTFSDSEQRFTIPRIDVWSLDNAHVCIQKTRGSWDWLLP
jgi:hypothetical protein